MNKQQIAGVIFCLSLAVTTAGFAQKAETKPASQPDSATVTTAAAAPATIAPSTATGTPVTAATVAPKPQVDQAKIEADRFLENALSRDASGLHRGFTPEKAEYVDMANRFSMVSMIIKHSDGTKSIICVDNYDDARKALDTPSAPVAPLQ